MRSRRARSPRVRRRPPPPPPPRRTSQKRATRSRTSTRVSVLSPKKKNLKKIARGLRAMASAQREGLRPNDRVRDLHFVFSSELSRVSSPIRTRESSKKMKRSVLWLSRTLSVVPSSRHQSQPLSNTKQESQIANCRWTLGTVSTTLKHQTRIANRELSLDVGGRLGEEEAQPGLERATVTRGQRRRHLLSKNA